MFADFLWPAANSEQLLPIRVKARIDMLLPSCTKLKIEAAEP
jgi:hypothetical protein